LAEQKGLELDCGCQLITKNRVIDVDKWLQILTNLLGNAIKYTEEGKVKLDIYEDKSRPDWIYAEVSDTGPGISDEDRNDVFMPFGGAGAEHISGMGSSGLGLTISRELALLMGGDLLLMPSKQGARFVLELPAETWSDRAPESSVPAVPAVMDWDGSGIKVLMAEDNELNIMYAKALLQRWKVTFDVVPNGAEALEQMNSKDYDLVLLDVQMPVMDGLETLQRIRSNERREESGAMPVYMVTAFADDETRNKAMDAGASGFVAKPFAPAELQEVLSQIAKKG
jgi:CheY-like chemotaxis protein